MRSTYLIPKLLGRLTPAPRMRHIYGAADRTTQNAPNVMRSNNLIRKLLPPRIKRQKAESLKTAIKAIKEK